MNIQTVMEIIALLDKKIDEKNDNPRAQIDEYYQLILFRDELQGLIESQVSQVENEMNGGQ